MKVCKICQQEKSETDFYKLSGKYLSSYCKSCHNKKSYSDHVYNPQYVKDWRRKNPDRMKRYKRQAKLGQYGITPQDYDQLLAQQNGGCACCGQPPNGKNLAIDHDHITGKVRGLLCLNCNLILGLVQDDPSILRSLADYLEKC